MVYSIRKEMDHHLICMNPTYPRPVLVISRCIEFEACRYDESLIPSPFVSRLRRYADCIPVCPEMEIGLGIPRDTVRIVRTGGVDHLIQPATGRDVTGEMTTFARTFLGSLPPVDGFILKGGSPTSGLGGVRVYPSAGKSMAIEKTAGFFAREVLREFPKLPAEDELRLRNHRIRDHFLTAVYTLAAYRTVEKSENREKLAEFHAQNKYLLMACHQQNLRNMGRLVASRAHMDTGELFASYRMLLSEALARVPRYSGYINVLQHILGYFSDTVSHKEKEYCLQVIDRYRQNLATLAEPRSLLYSWVIRFDNQFLKDQTFFAPYPADLADLPEEITDRGRDMWNR
jgi:uncharacterized protein YbgA (DUF1722 family)/uncharacterized protein YbbK (DUF523 family)